MALIYFDFQHAIMVHDKILAISGGIGGIKDENLIISPLAHIENDDYYTTFEEKLTHLVYTFNKSHGFSDGNKRTSIALGAFFLVLNGLDVFVDKFIIEMENIAVAVADNLIDKPMLERIISSLINEEEFSEVLKVEILDALTKVIPDPIGDPYIHQGPQFFLDLF